MKYILGIDQSTQGTKLALFDEEGSICDRIDRPHHQYISREGWVSHDLNEIYQNILSGLQELLQKNGLNGSEICGVGISNQRETTCAFDRKGIPLAKAIVWQCGRAAAIAARHENEEDLIFRKTGLKLSPYYPASKMQWYQENECRDLPDVHYGTVETYLICRLTGGKSYVSDASNASRTQLCNIRTMDWDMELLDLFHIKRKQLPQIIPCDGDFGMTDFEGILPHPVPILAAMGDSHAALYGQNCRRPGMIKATYGTGSSVMMNIGPEAVFDPRLSTSIAYQAEGKTVYCLEGNINYTGAVITWLKDDLKMISSPSETEELIAEANEADHTCVVPAFTGLSAPHWQMDARAAIMHMSRTTGRNEIVKAAVDSIAQQVSDVLDVMREASRQKVQVLRVDGGPTRNSYLMKIQSLLADCRLEIPDREELSVIGAAYLAGRKAGMYDDRVFDQLHYRMVESEKDEEKRKRMRRDWRAAMDGIISCAETEKQPA